MPKDLIIVRAGPQSLHGTWIDRGAPRSWDLLVCPYAEIPAPPEGAQGLLISEPILGLKFAALRLLLKEWQEWRDYRYIMLVDDDLFATQDTWSRFLDRCAHYDAKLAAPGLTERSFFSHLITVRNTEFVARRTSFVESMAPAFRADVLAELLPTLDIAETGAGWGIDFLWAKLLSYKDIFIIDETAIVHTRPVGRSRAPELHKQVSAELERIVREYQLPCVQKTFSGRDLNGHEVTMQSGALSYRLARGYQRVFEQRPELFDRFLRSQFTELP